MTAIPEGAAHPRISDPNESLWRQVHSNWISKDNEPTSQLFSLFPKDKGCVSVAQGSVCGAEESYRRHIDRGLRTMGVLAVTVGQVERINANISVIDDSAEPELPDEHASIDMTALAPAEVRDAARRLRRVAVDNGWTFGPV